MLEVRDLSVRYAQHRALDGISLTVGRGEIVVILGANGAGKSTLLKTIGGTCEGRCQGTVTFDGQPLTGAPANRIVEQGIALVPEGRGVFGDLTVRENLTLGAYSARARRDEAANLDQVFALFPKLVERKGQTVRTMSGGEQQMVAIGRALMSNPAILLLDEPSLGLSPLLCTELFNSLTRIRTAGIGILLVEQNARRSLAIADRGYLLENAHIVHEDSAANLATDPSVQLAYLGAGAAPEGDPEPPAPTQPPPTAPRIAPASPETRKADALLGFSIDGLVDRAAATERPAPAVTDGPVATSGSATEGDRLRAMLAEIERSATRARTKRRHRSPPSPPRDTKGSGAAKPAVPVIEIYRAPRVEVYRRRPGGGDFQREPQE